MALTHEDLQAISALMQQQLEPINNRLDKLEQSQVTQEQNQQAMQDHIASLASDVSYLNHSIEPKLDKVLEMVASANDRNRQLDLVTDKIENHEHRLFAVEEVLRKAE